MTQEELNALLQEMIQRLRGLKIPVSERIQPEVTINRRAKKRLGCCFCGKDGVYRIEVSASLLSDPEKLRMTLAHELLHTCYGCMNHGKRWKSYALRVKDSLGISVSRLMPLKEEEQSPEEVLLRYVVECQSCKKRYPRQRLSNLIKHPERYRCGKCGGKLKRLC